MLSLKCEKLIAGEDIVKVPVSTVAVMIDLTWKLFIAASGRKADQRYDLYR